MKQVLACALRGKKPAALEGQGLPQSQAGSGWSLLSRPLCAENIWVGLVLSMETGQVVPTTSRSSCPQRFLSDYGLQWVGEPMDQEDSEEKIASENDERDWMTAKKFWKPGTVEHLPWPPSALLACHYPRGPLFQALASQYWGGDGAAELPTPCP